MSGSKQGVVFLVLGILAAGVLIISCDCMHSVAEEIAVPSAAEREATRTFPSVFQAWSGVENKPAESSSKRTALHDIVFTGCWSEDLFQVPWDISETQPYQGLASDVDPDSLSAARQKKKALLLENPAMVFLCELRYKDAWHRTVEQEQAASQGGSWWEVGYFPPDSPYWKRDGNGDPIISWGEDTNGNGYVDAGDDIVFYLIDFENTAVQNLVVQQALGVKRSGVFDGIMLDWWKDGDGDEEAADDAGVSAWDARVAMLRATREEVGEDFLILVNANYRKVPRSASYVNGLFMECYKRPATDGYGMNEILSIESTLLWAEASLRAPHISCLEGWRVCLDGEHFITDLADTTRIAERNTPANRQWMRMFTCLGLTHSDGYVLFGDDNAIPLPDHLHNWYGFWDVSLGQPVIGDSGQTGGLYNGMDGVFIREFQRGWAVYNRSGVSVVVDFDDIVLGVESGIESQSHTIGNMDGEILLK